MAKTEELVHEALPTELLRQAVQRPKSTLTWAWFILGSGFLLALNSSSHSGNLKQAGMTPKQFLRQIEKPPLKSAYLLLGNELFYRDRCRRTLIRAALGDVAVEAGAPEGLIEIDLSEQPLSRLIDEARTLSLFASTRVIVGTSAEAVLPRGAAVAKNPKAASEFAALAAYARNPSPGVVLLLESTRYDWGDRDDKSRIDRVVRAFSKSVEIVELVKLTPSVALKTATALAKQLQLRIAPALLSELVDTLGSDMARLAGELEKLALYAGPEGEITGKQIELLIPEARQRGVFEFSEALSKGDRLRALDVLDTLARTGTSWPMQISLIASLFRQALAAKEERALNATQVTQLFSRHEIRIWPARARQVLDIGRHFSQHQLETALTQLSQADRDLRRERPSDRLIMEQLVLSLTA